jgi:GDP-4-dehydro-6-deoxy-D-mannose reductase
VSAETAPPCVLVTGGDGFVGRYLVRALAAALPSGHEIVVGAHGPRAEDAAGVRRVPLDVTDAEQVSAVLAAERPTHVIHLAAIAAIQAARRDVRQTWAVNFGGSLNVAIAVADAVPDCRVLFCGSGLVYGTSAQGGRPFDETAPLDPGDAYGASKAAADLMVGQMAKQGLRAIRLRPFNHTGPGQSEHFVVPAFAAQIAKIERGEQDAVMKVGSLTNRRDFLDVRDVVDAYVRALLRFDDLPSGCVLNVASGRTVSMREVLDMLLALSPKKIEIMEDPGRVRSNDASIVVGDASLARRLLGWEPHTTIGVTLSSVLEHYRGH